MKSLLCFAAVGILALAANGQAQESKTTKATYMVTGLHWGACVTTLEGSLKKTKGVKSIKGDFKSKSAATEFDESVISAQEVARAMSVTPHMMGRDMQYGGILLLSVAGVKDEAAGMKAKAALSKVEGVARVTIYPKHEAVGIEFTGKGKATTKQLLHALEAAGLKGGQYGTASGAGGQTMNGGNGHADMAMNNGGNAGGAWVWQPGMPMDNGANGGPTGMGQRMGCGYAPYGPVAPAGNSYRRGCGGCR